MKSPIQSINQLIKKTLIALIMLQIAHLLPQETTTTSPFYEKRFHYIETELIHLQNTLFAEINKKIATQEIALESAIKQLKNNQKTIFLLQELKKNLINLQSNNHYLQQKTLISWVHTIQEITHYNNHLLQPTLLEEIRITHHQVEAAQIEQLVSFLRQQLVRLLETSDELFLVQNITNQAHTFTQQLTLLIQKESQSLTQTTEYNAWKTLQKDYLATKLVKKIQKILTKIKKLKNKKQLILIKNKEYQSLLEEKEFLIYKCPSLKKMQQNQLEFDSKIIKIEENLYFLPLELLLV